MFPFPFPHAAILGGSSVNAIAVHTGYTSSSGTCSASTELSAAWQAVDNVTSTDYASTNTGVPCWWKYEFTDKQLSGGYSIRATSNANYINDTPKSWTFEGSSNGVDWDVLDTVNNEPAWTASEKRTYTFKNTTNYKYYRLYITANYSSSWVSIGELEILI